jgi:hypothetical protein
MTEVRHHCQMDGSSHNERGPSVPDQLASPRPQNEYVTQSTSASYMEQDDVGRVQAIVLMCLRL